MLTDETRETMGLLWKVPLMAGALVGIGLLVMGLVAWCLE